LRSVLGSVEHSSMDKCPFCSSTDIVYSTQRGDKVCGQCGELLEESSMVAEASFVRGANGAAHTAGSRVAWAAPSLHQGGVSTTNQELAISRGATKISWIADRLQLSQQVQEAGQRMYRLAVELNFNTGRPTRFVASACLYIVCRRNRSPHLLIDFSDVLQSPVKRLARFYVSLLQRLVGGDPAQAQALGNGVPIVDPSIFIDRFARKLDFGGLQRKVQNTATRIIECMHRDWICIGRRPNGLCGAALLIASFYHGFKLTAKDVAETVRMTEGTLRTRLTEMQQTPFALMSRAQLQNGDLKAIQDATPALPPVMNRRKRLRNLQALTDEEKRAALTDGSEHAPTPQQLMGSPKQILDSPTAKQILDSPTARQILESPIAEHALNSPTRPLLPLADGGVAPSQDSASTGGTAQEDDAERKKRNEQYTVKEPTPADIEDIAKDITETLLSKDGSRAEAGHAKDWAVAASLVGDLVKQKPDYDNLSLVPTNATKDPAKDGATGPTKTAPPSSIEPSAGSDDEAQGSETLSDIADEELDQYLLDEEERQSKSDIWHEVNKDYLEEWHRRGIESKRRKEEKAAAETASNGSKKRAAASFPPAATCTQSAMMALAKKSKVNTNRINIEALESLFA